MSKRTLTAVVYLRVSTESQAEHGYSLEDQRRSCLEKAHALSSDYSTSHDCNVDLVTAEFCDTVSGDLSERPGLQEAMKYIHLYRPEYFICLDPDRVSRQLPDLLRTDIAIRELGTTVVFVNHNRTPSPEGDIFFHIRGAVAQYEKAKILERTQRGRREKVRQGSLGNGLRMFGYNYDKERDCAQINPDEARWVTQIFEWAAREELNYQAIADKLNYLGAPTKAGGQWHRSTVNKLLSNRGYIGELQVNRWDTTGLGVQRQLAPEHRSKKITPRQRPEAEWVTIQIPQIVQPELWEAAQRRPGKAVRRTPCQGLLRGLATCGCCGGRIHYSAHPTQGHVLRCANRYPRAKDETGIKRCTLPHQAASLFERQVWKLITEWLLNPELFLEYLKSRSEKSHPSSSDPAAQVARLRAHHDQKRQQHKRLIGLIQAGVTHGDTAMELLKGQASELSRLEQELREAEKRLEAFNSRPRGPMETIASVERVRAQLHTHVAPRLDFDALSPEQRRKIALLLITEVVVHPQGKCQVVARQ